MVIALQAETPVSADTSASIRALNHEAFGIYRPFTPESASLVAGVLACAEPEVEAFLRRERRVKTADMLPNAEFGTTFISRRRVGQALMSPSFKKGFDEIEAVEGTMSYIQDKTDQLPIPIGNIEWIGRGDRHLVFRVDPIARLIEEASIMQFYMDRANGNSLRLKPPNHATLFKYGSPRDRMGLNSRQRARAALIVAEHFREAGVEAVTLNRPVLGNSYYKPWNSESSIVA
ncbi:MAG TPA: hypothetical protein VH234_01730 [Candidatus Saccharimonadales bacterium]|jgi:hypothetical protein|nr:hypothetical protein [Candidatus Saccharimonadales bacterium]